jgi:ribose transport system substrate-binding protein
MLDALKANPDINLVYAHNDPMAHGAYLAAKQAGVADKMKFIGIDANPNEGQHWVKTGELTATFLYPTPGEKGLQVALEVLQGKQVPKRNALPTRIFTKETADKGGTPVE